MPVLIILLITPLSLFDHHVVRILFVCFAERVSYCIGIMIYALFRRTHITMVVVVATTITACHIVVLSFLYTNPILADHVWSLYTECRYDTGWRNHFEELLPELDQNNMSIEEGFDFWLSQFVVEHDGDGNNSNNSNNNDNNDYEIDTDQINDFDCYHPANYQSKFFTSQQQQNIHGLDLEVGFEPDVEKAVETMRTLDWVGLQDLYHESKCLLYYRILLSEDNDNNNNNEDAAATTSIQHQAMLGNVAPDEMQFYLDSFCHCNGEQAVAPDPHLVPKRLTDTQLTHHQNGHRPQVRNLPIQTLHKVDALIQSDIALFQAALQDFIHEIVWLEESLGRQVFCDATREQLEPELAYLFWGMTPHHQNVTELYLHALL